MVVKEENTPPSPPLFVRALLWAAAADCLVRGSITANVLLVPHQRPQQHPVVQEERTAALVASVLKDADSSCSRLCLT